jgi:cell surface protein SprA
MKSGSKFYIILNIFSLFIVINACKKEPKAVIVPDAKIYPLGIPGSWKFASAPLSFQESMLTNDISCGFNRAKFSWYAIDPLFYDKNSAIRPANISNGDLSSDDCRYILKTELFPSKNQTNEIPEVLETFNLDFYPAERGPWNYDTDPSAYSAGIDYNGNLNNPSSRWGGMQRLLSEVGYKFNYIDFWLLDPFTISPDAVGELYFNLGDISEDILKDGLISGENITGGDVTETVWGQVWPQNNAGSVVTTFPLQTDKGLDELNDQEEQSYFANYLGKVASICSTNAFQEIVNDPAGDNFHYFMGHEYDNLNYKIRRRYKYFNGDERNSTEGNEAYSAIATRIPDGEDLNSDHLLATGNNYFEYKISISSAQLNSGTNYLVGTFQSYGVPVPDGYIGESKFYHFRIPLSDYTAQYGTPSTGNNPKFMRVYLSGFSTPVNLRIINFVLSEEIVETTN